MEEGSIYYYYYGYDVDYKPGPFESYKMRKWYNEGHFPVDLKIEIVCDINEKTNANFTTTLAELCRVYGSTDPFPSECSKLNSLLGNGQKKVDIQGNSDVPAAAQNSDVQLDNDKSGEFVPTCQVPSAGTKHAAFLNVPKELEAQNTSERNKGVVSLASKTANVEKVECKAYVPYLTGMKASEATDGVNWTKMLEFHDLLFPEFNAMNKLEKNRFLKKVEEYKVPNYCHLCDAILRTSYVAFSHFLSGKHIANIYKSGNVLSYEKDYLALKILIESVKNEAVNEANAQDIVEIEAYVPFCTGIKVNATTDGVDCMTMTEFGKILGDAIDGMNKLEKRQLHKKFEFPNKCHFCNKNWENRFGAFSHFFARKHIEKIYKSGKVLSYEKDYLALEKILESVKKGSVVKQENAAKSMEQSRNGEESSICSSGFLDDASDETNSSSGFGSGESSVFGSCSSESQRSYLLNSSRFKTGGFTKGTGGIGASRLARRNFMISDMVGCPAVKSKCSRSSLFRSTDEKVQRFGAAGNQSSSNSPLFLAGGFTERTGGLGLRRRILD